jgi:hypothetical protein
VNIKRYKAILAIIGIIIAIGIAGNMDVEDEQLQLDHYCEMVKLWKESDGRQGWPDYDGIYGTAGRK